MQNDRPRIGREDQLASLAHALGIYQHFYANRVATKIEDPENHVDTLRWTTVGAMIRWGLYLSGSGR